MPIRGLSDQRRLSRLGKIKLGIVVQEPGKNPYPRATDYFVCPVEVREVFGDKPTSLDVMFPVENAAVIFPQMYKAYKASGLYCAGDGSVARRWSEQGTLLERECPCDLLKAGECKPIATLNIVLPAVRGLGVYQIVTSSPRSIVAINSALDTFAAAFGGLRGIPFVLKLEPEQTQRWDERRAQMVKTTVHVLRLDSPHSMNEILAWRRALGKPVEALMPAPEHEASDAQEPRPDEPANGQAEPSAWTVAARSSPTCSSGGAERCMASELGTSRTRWSPRSRRDSGPPPTRPRVCFSRPIWCVISTAHSRSHARKRPRTEEAS